LNSQKLGNGQQRSKECRRDPEKGHDVEHETNLGGWQQENSCWCGFFRFWLKNRRGQGEGRVPVGGRFTA
jgi:hypothetical protein